VSSDLVATIDPFLYSISAVVCRDADPAAVEGVILDEVERLRDVPLSDGEIERARKQTRAQFAYSVERVTDQGFWLGLAEMVADQAWYEQYLARLDAVTAEDVRQVARARLDERMRTVGHYRPTGATCDLGAEDDDGDGAEADDKEPGA
jgi:zinc protease